MTALFSNRIFRLVVPVAVSAWLFVIGTGAESAKGADARRPAAGSGGLKLQTPEPRTPLEHNNRGVELGSKGLWPQAIKEHEKALAGDPYNPGDG